MLSTTQRHEHYFIKSTTIISEKVSELINPCKWHNLYIGVFLRRNLFTSPGMSTNYKYFFPIKHSHLRK